MCVDGGYQERYENNGEDTRREMSKRKAKEEMAKECET